MSSEEELKQLLPCPFCGGEATWRRDRAFRYTAFCAGPADCNAELPASRTKAEAIDAWNTRAAVPSVSCEKLEALVKRYRKYSDDADHYAPERCGAYRIAADNLQALIEESRRGA